jgi:hypothetical protein
MHTAGKEYHGSSEQTAGAFGIFFRDEDVFAHEGLLAYAYAQEAAAPQPKRQPQAAPQPKARPKASRS